MLRQTRLTILWSLAAVALVLLQVAVFSQIFFADGAEVRVVNERSDIVGSADEVAEVVEVLAAETSKFSSEPLPGGEIWHEKEVSIYATPDADICVGGGLDNLGEMYWQTSDTNVIAGFYDSARTFLGYGSSTCRFPKVVGTGSVTITAGTYDGKRKDSIKITVFSPPTEEWKDDVLMLVNDIRDKNGLLPLEAGETCEIAANTRAMEIKTDYGHTRPDGSEWYTVCALPETGGANGENLAAGNAAVSPQTVVALWMGSEKHRENILNPEFTKLAVGFEFDLDTKYRNYWSQFFSTY